MKCGIGVKRDVEAELKSDPDIDATGSAVPMKNDVATQTGFVKSSGGIDHQALRLFS